MKMTLQDKILEIIQLKGKNLSQSLGAFYVDCVFNDEYNELAKEISDHIKEFIEWLAFKSHGNFNPRFELHKYWDGTVNEFRSVFRQFTGLTWEDITLEELYIYWLTQIKGK